jgi:hypothetical protein
MKSERKSEHKANEHTDVVPFVCSRAECKKTEGEADLGSLLFDRQSARKKAKWHHYSVSPNYTKEAIAKKCRVIFPHSICLIKLRENRPKIYCSFIRTSQSR